MLLFFGTRSTELDTRIIRKNFSCPHCNTENSYRVTTYGTYLHVLFIPIITLGKKYIIECEHCKKTYHKNELPDSLDIAIKNSYERIPPKKGLWQSFGCLSIVSLFLFSFLLSLFIWIFAVVADFFSSDSSNNNESVKKDEITTVVNLSKPTWNDKLKEKMYVADFFPDIEKDPIAFGIYNCLESHLSHSEKGDISYKTTVNDNKILILVGPLNMKKLNERQKDSLYKKIDFCIDNILKFKSYERYIGVFKGSTLFMQKTPKGIVKDSTANKSDLLKAFFVSNNPD